MNTDELLKKANAGTIRPAEIQEVFRALKTGSGDRYSLLLIIGRANAREYRDAVEQFLNDSDDPMLARLALQILCRYWGLERDYKDVIERFVKGVSWDDEEDVRIMAISCSSALLKAEGSARLLSFVYDAFRNEDESDGVRGAAYEALAVAAGKNILDLPQPARLDLKRDIDRSVIDAVEARLTGG